MVRRIKQIEWSLKYNEQQKLSTQKNLKTWFDKNTKYFLIVLDFIESINRLLSFRMKTQNFYFSISRIRKIYRIFMCLNLFEKNLYKKKGALSAQKSWEIKSYLNSSCCPLYSGNHCNIFNP